MPSTLATTASFARRGPIAAATPAAVVPAATSRTEPSGSVTRTVATVSGISILRAENW